MREEGRGKKKIGMDSNLKKAVDRINRIDRIKRAFGRRTPRRER